MNGVSILSLFTSWVDFFQTFYGRALICAQEYGYMIDEQLLNHGGGDGSGGGENNWVLPWAKSKVTPKRSRSPYETPSSSFPFVEVSRATWRQVLPSTIPGYFSGCVVQIHLHWVAFMGCLLDLARSRRYKKVGLERYALSTKKYNLKNVKSFSSFLSWVQQVALITVFSSIVCSQGHTIHMRKGSLYLLDAPTEWLEDAWVLLHVIIIGDPTNENVRVALNLGEASLPTDEKQNTVQLQKKNG